MSLELAAQLLDVNLQRIGEPIVPLVPDVLVNPRPRQDLAGMPQEEDQQRVLLGRQRQSVCPLRSARCVARSTRTSR